MPVPVGADVVRRWAAGRIEEMAARGDGVEASIALAAQAKLVTPWTGWFLTSSHFSQPFAQRILQLSPTFDAPFATQVEPSPAQPSLLFEPPSHFDGDTTLEDAARAAAQRAIKDAQRLLSACRDARAAVRPDVAEKLSVELVIGLDGRASNIRVRAQSSTEDDAVLNRCVRGVLAALPFFHAGAPVAVTDEITFAQGRGSRRTSAPPCRRCRCPSEGGSGGLG